MLSADLVYLFIYSHRVVGLSFGHHDFTATASITVSYTSLIALDIAISTFILISLVSLPDDCRHAYHCCMAHAIHYISPPMRFRRYFTPSAGYARYIGFRRFFMKEELRWHAFREISFTKRLIDV